MSIDGTERAVREWLLEEATAIVPPTELRQRVANVPYATPRLLMAPSRRWVVLAVAATLATAILLGALAVIGSRPQLRPLSFHLGQVAYTVGSDIYVANTDGSDQLRVTDSAGKGLGYWSPRWYGDWLAFLGTAHVGDGTGDLFLRDTRSGSVRDLGRADAFTGTDDGARFGLVTWSDLTIVDADGTVVTHPSLPSGYDRWDLSDLSSLSLSNDGGTLLVGACTTACRKDSEGGVNELFLVPLDGGAPQRLTSETRNAWGAKLSPDGSLIAFTLLPPDANWDWSLARIWLMKRDGADRRVLDTPAGVDMGPWSPDGEQIAFRVREGASGLGDCCAPTAMATIGIIDAAVNASKATMFGQGLELVRDLHWSPDGTRLIAVARESATGHTGLWAFGADGSNAQLLVPNLDPNTTAYDWQWVTDSPE
jgi:hypothetical protein